VCKLTTVFNIDRVILVARISRFMPSETTVLLRSIRRWVLLSTFLLGVGVVTVADMGYILSNYQDEVVWAIAGFAGGLVALAAGIQFVRTYLPDATDTRPSTE
jgi:hypothetical protein